MNTPSERLKIARSNAGWENGKLAAKHHGWKYSTYKTHESGGRNFDIRQAREYATAYGVTVGWLLNGEDEISTLVDDRPTIPVRRVPIMMPASIAELIALSEGKKPKSDRYITIDAAPDVGPRAAAYQVTGAAMQSTSGDSFSDGDLVIIDPDRKPEPGCYVLAVVGDVSMLRQFAEVKHGRIDEYELLPRNNAFAAIRTSALEGSRIVGRAVRHIRKL